jgi:hypothetical protein
MKCTSVAAMTTYDSPMSTSLTTWVQSSGRFQRKQKPCGRKPSPAGRAAARAAVVSGTDASVWESGIYEP